MVTNTLCKQIREVEWSRIQQQNYTDWPRRTIGSFDFDVQILRQAYRIAVSAKKFCSMGETRLGDFSSIL